jgi:hypothetical protein
VTVYPEEFEGLCARVHDWWMQASRVHGRHSATSRHDDGSADLMVPYEELAEIDREDDRRVVWAVLNGLSKLPLHVVNALVVTAPTDGELLALIRQAAQQVDPPPTGLADDCAETAAREDDQR